MKINDNQIMALTEAQLYNLHSSGLEEKIVLNSDNIQWKGKRGVTYVSNHHQFNYSNIPHYLYIKSSKTGMVKEFEQEFDEDGFDGEFWRFNSDDGITVTIMNG